MAEPGFAQVPGNQNIHAAPAGPLPKIFTYADAYEALAKEPKIYTIYIDGKKTRLLELFRQLQDPNTKIPRDISIRHPDHWSITLYNYGDTFWTLSMSPPLASYGVLTRSYANVPLTIPDGNLFLIWEILSDYFPTLWDDVVRMQVLESKMHKMQANAMGSLANKANIPENMVPFLESYVIPRPRVKGWARGEANLKKIKTNLFTNGEVPINRNLKKINTTLFTKGGKRKLRKTKTRKQAK